MRTILLTVFFFLALCGTTYHFFVTYMAEKYGTTWDEMSKTTNEVMLAQPLKTSVMILVIGLLAYWVTWFTFRKRK